MRRHVRWFPIHQASSNSRVLWIPIRLLSIPNPQEFLSSPMGLFAILSGRGKANAGSDSGQKRGRSFRVTSSIAPEGDRGSFFNRDAVSLAVIIILLTAVYEAISSQKAVIARKFSEALFITLEVRSSREEYAMIVDWMGRQPHGQRARNITLMPLSVHDEFDKDKDSPNNLSSDNRDLFVPGFGSHYMTFNGTHLWISRSLDTSKQHRPSSRMDREDEVLQVVFFSRDREVARRFMEEVRSTWTEQARRTVQLYLPNDWGSRWEFLARRLRRPLDTLYFPPETMEIARETKFFLQSRELYAALGVPWRRGYLFEGLPGTGKTSFILALASECSLPVYLLSLQSKELDDASLIGLINSVPPRCLLVIEDLETAIKTGGAMGGTEVGGGRDSGVSLSALLNAIDGIASSEGRLLVITANDASKLPSPHALLRPGRIDRQVHFGSLKQEEMQMMLQSFQSKLAVSLGRKESLSLGLPKNKSLTTPAELQNELLSAIYRHHIMNGFDERMDT